MTLRYRLIFACACIRNESAIIRRHLSVDVRLSANFNHNQLDRFSVLEIRHANLPIEIARTCNYLTAGMSQLSPPRKVAVTRSCARINHGHEDRIADGNAGHRRCATQRHSSSADDFHRMLR